MRGKKEENGSARWAYKIQRKKVTIIGRKNLHLTEEEKKERARLASKRYRERQKKKLEEGDARAQALREKKLYRTGYTSALAFIRKKIKRQDISAVRDALAERQKELMKLKKEKSKKE